MDRDVTIRFYELRHQDGAGADLGEVMAQINDLGKRDREKEVTGGVTLRLEHLEERNGLLLGDITRVQTENLPGHVTDDANDPLPVDRIGHPAAFCFDPDTYCIALQFDMKIGVGRVCNYFSQFANGTGYAHMPILRQDALARFEHETPTSLSIRVARVRNFQHANMQISDVEEHIEALGALFGAPSVEITVSCKGVDGGINRNRTINTVRRWLGLKEEIDGIRKITGTTIESDEAFNFVKSLLKESETLDLPANDPADGMARRLRHVRAKYELHQHYIRAVTGVA